MGDLNPGTELVNLDLFVIANLLAITIAYLWAARRAGRLGEQWSISATVCFLAAMVALTLAYLGPFGAWAHQVFWAHMGQHLLVLMLAAPLIVLSAPVRLAFINLGPVGRRRLVAALRSRPMEILSNPFVGWILFAAVLLGTHTQAVMNWSLTTHDAMEFVIRPLYLVAALLFYYPLITRDLIAYRPAPAVRVISLGLMMIPETALGIVIHFAPVPLYFAYVDAGAIYGIDVMMDQKFAGALMWAIAMVLDGIWMMVAAVEWWQSEERKTRKLEREEALTLGAGS
jgi:putative membrane protein